MVIIMDASTGEREYESDYGDEVLNAGWLPQPELGLQLLAAVPACPHRQRNIIDPDSFLRNMYACQE
ncbi:MAG: hypothetical protein RIR70_1475 [Pseudomonadota bacterium]|jgi:hypothetical protein